MEEKLRGGFRSSRPAWLVERPKRARAHLIPSTGRFALDKTRQVNVTVWQPRGGLRVRARVRTASLFVVAFPFIVLRRLHSLIIDMKNNDYIFFYILMIWNILFLIFLIFLLYKIYIIHILFKYEILICARIYIIYIFITSNNNFLLLQVYREIIFFKKIFYYFKYFNYIKYVIFIHITLILFIYKIFICVRIFVTSNISVYNTCLNNCEFVNKR